MNKKQSFNSGAKMGIRLSEDIVKRDAAAVEQLNKLAKQLPGKFVEIQEVVSSLSSSVEKIEVEKVFGIIRTKGVEDLEYEEQIILLKVLQQIASYSEPNLSQRNFMRRLSGTMGINIDDIMYNSYADIALIDEIDSRSVHRLMYQVVKEYLYLGNNSHQYNGDYEFILSQFSRDVKKDETETLITFKVSLFGSEILYEQYGDVSFERNEIEEDIDEIHTTIKDIKYTASLSLLRFGLINFDMASAIGSHREEEYLFTEFLNKRSKETDKAYQDFIEKHENDHSICLEFNDILTQINDSFITNKAVVNTIRGIKNSDDISLQEFTFGVQNRVGALLFIFTPNDVFVFGEDEIIYLDYKCVTHIEQNYEGLTITYCMANNCKTEPASRMNCFPSRGQ